MTANREVLDMFADMEESKDSTIAWYDPAVGGFYISERTIPVNIINTGRLIELIRKHKK